MPLLAQNQRRKRFRSSQALNNDTNILSVQTKRHRPHRLVPWQRLWQPQKRCPCLTAAGSESAGKACLIVTGPSDTNILSVQTKSIGPFDSYHGSDSGNLSNAVLVSLPLAQNQRGKRFRSSQAPPTPTYSLFKRKGIGPIDSYHGSDSGNLINAVLVSLPLAQNQRGKRFRSSQATQHRHQHTLFSDEKASAPGSDSSNLSNAVLVSLPLAQNQRGKRFRSSQAPQD